MINRIYNIIIYAHFAENTLDDYFSNNPNADTSDYNNLPSSIKEYLSEKSNKYLGLEFDEIDHNKLFLIIHGTLIVDDISVILNQFEPLMSRISSEQNLTLEETSHSPIPGWVVSPFIVSGADYIVTDKIKTYIDLTSESELVELTRDLQIKNILT